MTATLRALGAMPAAPADGDAAQLPIDPHLAQLPSSQPLEPSQTPSSPERRKLRRRPKIRPRQPARGSVYDLLCRNAGTSLFLRPLFWTDAHTRILGVRFRELPRCNLPVPADVEGSPPSRGQMRPSAAAIQLSQALSELVLASSPLHGSMAVKTVLATLWPDAFPKGRALPDMHLFFGGRVYREAVRTQVVWDSPAAGGGASASTSRDSFMTASTDLAESFVDATPADSTPPNIPYPASVPIMCYLGKEQIRTMRRTIFRVAQGPRGYWNGPVWRLQQLRSKMLMPSDADRDPHLAGIFLAMAQRHFYPVPPRSSRRDHSWATPDGAAPCHPTFHDVRLRVLTHDADTSDFIVYTATVTAGFLQRFHDPFSAPAGDAPGDVPGLDIEYTRVPVWPMVGLRERMGRALGEDVVGPFDPDEMETWQRGREDGEDDDEVELEKRGRAGKRRREALSEVFNDSFEDDEGDETAGEPAVSAKKRCLSEGAQVGVVV